MALLTDKEITGSVPKEIRKFPWPQNVLLGYNPKGFQMLFPDSVRATIPS